MSGANYAYCPGCNQKARYVGEDDVGDGIQAWHTACLEGERDAVTAIECDRIRQLATDEAAKYPVDAEWGSVASTALTQFAELLGEPS